MRTRQEGFTLFEVLVSVALLAILMAVMAPAFLSQVRFNTLSEQRTEAMAAAQQVLDGLRRQDPSAMRTSGSDPATNIIIGSRTYRVVASYCETSSYCTSNNSRHIRIRVTRNGKELYDVQTVYTKLN